MNNVTKQPEFSTPGSVYDLTNMGAFGRFTVDSDSPSPELKAKLDAFAHAGGLVIVPRSLAAQFAGEKPIQCPVAGYDLRSLGKGSLAAATRHWDDPYFLAADVHSLVRRRNDPATLFNAQSVWEHYSMAPDGRAALLQLVGFTSRPNERGPGVPILNRRNEEVLA